MNRRLFKSFGWKGVIALAWLGTPVHEFSHVIGCWLGRNDVEEFALFHPDKTSGSLGFVKHSYDRNSFYQRVIGNTLAAVAPFFGGAVAIYLLTLTFYPSLLSIPENAPSFSWSELARLDGILEFSQAWILQIKRFFLTLFASQNLGRPQFWLYLFAMISVAAHLSPSASDFEGFWGPVAVLFLLVFVLNALLVAFDRTNLLSTFSLTAGIATLNALLILSFFFLLAGAIAVGIVTYTFDALFSK